METKKEEQSSLSSFTDEELMNEFVRRGVITEEEAKKHLLNKTFPDQDKTEDK